MNRRNLQALARLRQREAEALLKAGFPAGAYYLAGYAVECALKAGIARLTRRHDFPDRHIAQRAHTHNFYELLDLAGWRETLHADMQYNKALASNWDTVVDWKETVRYNSVVDYDKAARMHAACTNRLAGILPWIMQRW